VYKRQAQGKGIAGSAGPASTPAVMPDPNMNMGPNTGVYNQRVNSGGFGQMVGKGGSMPQQQQTQQTTMEMPPPQQPQQFRGKGSTTNSATSGQPRMGQANPYPNTIQPWDNASIQPQARSGKGKGY
jgi:hypothetical protein